MKVHFLSYAQIPSIYANAVHAMKVCQSLAKAGHEVTLFCRAGKGSVADAYDYYAVEHQFELVRCFRPPLLSGLGRVIWRRLVLRAIQSRPLPAVFYGTEPYTVSASARFGRPVVYEAHIPPEGTVPAKLLSLLFQQNNFARLVVITEALGREYRRLYPQLSPERIVVAPDCADIPQPITEGAVREVWAGRSTRLQIGYAGHLYSGRGIDVIVEIARRLPEADVHVVGGQAADLRYWRSQTEDIQNLMFHGFFPPSQVEGFRQSMDILLAPYQAAVLCEEGTNTTNWMSPMKVFEYMASRKPIVASDLPVLREVLTNDVNAWLVPPADVDAWVRALRTLAGDPALRQRLAEQAFEDIVTKFTWDRRAKLVLEGL